MVSLAITQPEPGLVNWIRDYLKMPEKDIYRAYRIHTTYQAVGRILRNRSDHSIKTVLVAGYEDARFLHQLYKGSTFLGQIGNLKPLEAAARKRWGKRQEEAYWKTTIGRVQKLLQQMAPGRLTTKAVRERLAIPSTSWDRVSVALKDPSTPIAALMKERGIEYHVSRGRGFSGFVLGEF